MTDKILRPVEIYVGHVDHTWGTYIVKVPINTPAEGLEKAAINSFIMDMKDYERSRIALIGIYSLSLPTIPEDLEEPHKIMMDVGDMYTQKWGTYGPSHFSRKPGIAGACMSKGSKDGATWVKLIDCSTDHLNAILKTQKNMGPALITIIHQILSQRKAPDQAWRDISIDSSAVQRKAPDQVEKYKMVYECFNCLRGFDQFIEKGRLASGHHSTCPHCNVSDYGRLPRHKPMR